MNISLPKDLPITIDPEIHTGTPVFRGTRVPIKTLFDNLADGYTLDEILEDFPSVNRKDATIILENRELVYDTTAAKNSSKD